VSIVLIGYRGSGKTTIGLKLADRLWQTFVDTDDLIVKRAAKSIREIFQQDGEPAFRELEVQAVRDASLLDEHVISLGGGAPMREENRSALKSRDHKIIYLRCDPKSLHERIESDPRTIATRPQLSKIGGGIEEIRAILAEREPVYRQLMTAELDVTNLSVDDAVVYIVRLL